MASPKLSTSRVLTADRPLSVAERGRTSRSSRIVASLLLDIAWILAATAIAYGLSSAIALVADLGIGSTLSMASIQWISTFVTLASALLFMFQDLVRLFSRRLYLPLEYSATKASSIYWQRLQVSLLAISFSLILIVVGIAFPRMVLVSRLFIATVFALTILAVRKSIPVAKAGFITSAGIFVATVITIFVVKVTLGSEAKSGSLTYPAPQSERLS
ncbi:hypothetical protein [Almyronema epifaneia]|uniref:Uncharacterized protein n=1 Tax=Almyronema epifaneia S1 TaxID=2991925 RepID=A0ABW6IHG9_9CYAN